MCLSSLMHTRGPHRSIQCLIQPDTGVLNHIESNPFITILSANIYVQLIKLIVFPVC